MLTPAPDSGSSISFPLETLCSWSGNDIAWARERLTTSGARSVLGRRPASASLSASNSSCVISLRAK